jgi:hypothetical protein
MSTNHNTTPNPSTPHHTSKAMHSHNILLILLKKIIHGLHYSTHQLKPRRTVIRPSALHHSIVEFRIIIRDTGQIVDEVVISVWCERLVLWEFHYIEVLFVFTILFLSNHFIHTLLSLSFLLSFSFSLLSLSFSLLSLSFSLLSLSFSSFTLIFSSFTLIFSSFTLISPRYFSQDKNKEKHKPMISIKELRNSISIISPCFIKCFSW